MNKYVLEARGIVKTFPGVRTLGGVDFAIREGEVHALVGENGAGKSTLMMILGGIYKPDEGEIFVEGEKIVFHSATDAMKKGIGVVYQELSLVPQLSVAENIFANRQPINRLGLIDKRELHKQAREMLAMFDIDYIDPSTIVSKLSIANQQVVEILKAMSENPKLIVLDEPTSSLTEVEVRQLFNNIRKLKEKGISFIYISHHLSEIFEIADTATVLRDGMKVTSANVAEIDEDFLVANMVGRCITNIYGLRKQDHCTGDVFFEAKNITAKGLFSDLSFTVREGEIVGFSGLVGAGRTEMGRAIFGVEKIDSGELYLDGNKIEIKSPEQAIAKGIGYMTEDRKSLGLYLNFDIRSNIAANRLKKFARRGFMLDQDLNAVCDQTIKQFRVATPSAKQKLINLSGGNQQKVMLAAWIGINPKVLIVDEPTRGVDVGAKCEIYEILRGLARENRCGIIMISSDLPEILGLSDRIYVMKGGRLVAEIDGKSATEEVVMKYAAGSDK